MKYWLSILVLCLFVGSTSLFAVTDSITPPPDFPNSITGPTESCVGDTSVFTIDMPISCSAMWYVDGVLQPTSTNELQYIWVTSGTFVVGLDIECDTILFNAGLIEIIVGDIPFEPAQITGDDEICIETTSIYTTEVGEGESCVWKVDGVVQISDSTSMSYYWSEMGDHIIEVSAVNECGIGNPTYLNTLVTSFPVVNLGSDTSIFIGQSLLLDAGNPGSYYLWSTGEITQTISVTETGNYEVTVTNPCGDAWDEIFVDVIVGADNYSDEDCIIFFIDDQLFIENTDYEQVYVYNLKGSLLLSSVVDQEHIISEKGILIIVLISSNGNIIRKKILKN